jgi:hypothetical protein
VSLPDPPPRNLSDEEEQAAELIPARKMPGPIPLQQHLHRLGSDDRKAWRQLLRSRKGRTHLTLAILALYWADGTRSILEISDIVELETGMRDVELLLAYFHILEKLELVAFKSR